MASNPEVSGPNPAWGVLVASTFVVAAVLRLAGLDSGLWFDEIVTLVDSARQPLREIVTSFPGVNAHPLYSVLAHGSIAALGESAFSLRLPASLFGIASVIMTYRLGTMILSRAEAWAAAALLTASYHHVWFSQNARGYTILSFLTLLSTYLLLSAARTGKSRLYVWYALTVAAGIYTHLTMGFVVLGQAMAALAIALRRTPESRLSLRSMTLALAAAGLLSAVAYAPFVPELVASLTSEAPRQAAKVATASWAASEGLRVLFSGTGVLVSLALGTFAALGLLSCVRRQAAATALLVAPGLVTALGIAALGHPMRPRFFFFLTGAAAIFAARGVGLVAERMARHRRGITPAAIERAVVVCTIPLVILSATALPTGYRLPKQDFGGAVRFLDTAQASGARVLVAGPACFPIQRYYERPWACLNAEAEWTAARSAQQQVVVAYTLADYISDPALRVSLIRECRVRQRFPGTLGGGEITVCEPAQADQANR